MDPIHHHALKLLARRDHTAAELRAKLEQKFGSIPDTLIDELTKKRFLDDRRFAHNFVVKKSKWSLEYLREQLLERGIEETIVAEELEKTERPSLRDTLNATMVDWNLGPPLHPRDAARLFRALNRLGYPEDAIREELEQLHGQ